MTGRFARRWPALVLGALLTACTTNPPPSAVPDTTRISCRIPTFAPLTETKESQEKGGVEIAVAPVTYEAVRATEQSEHEIKPSFGERLTAPPGWQAMRFVERVSRPVLRVTPDRLRFRVTLNNKLPRVFRGAGTVVQFNVSGKLIPVEQEGYAELLNIIVPPRSQQQVEIYGPPLRTLPDQTTVGIFLYDVVTKADAAGNVTEKQNFEWYYNYATQLREDEGAIQRERRWRQ